VLMRRVKDETCQHNLDYRLQSGPVKKDKTNSLGLGFRVGFEFRLGLLNSQFPPKKKKAATLFDSPSENQAKIKKVRGATVST